MLDFPVASQVKYADAVSGGKVITILVGLNSASDSTIQPPLMVFMNRRRSYPIRNVLDIIPDVSYRSEIKRWINTNVMPEMFKERMVI